jgi:RNA ligase (TIGR02306 family)
MVFERKLVTVRRISAVSSIPGADAIDCASVEGWKAVVGKGEFSPGDRCVYFEIDSFLPVDDPRYAFLAKDATTWRGRLGVRLCTMTMRRQISQGLAMPISKFPEVAAAVDGMPDAEARDVDFASALGVAKWEADIPDAMLDAAVGALPNFLKSPSLERVQNLPNLFLDHAGKRFDATVKIDGATAHVFNVADAVRCGCQNWELREREGEPTWRAARSAGLVDLMSGPEFDGVQVMAELYGKDVRVGYHESRDRPTLGVFHVYDFYKGRDYTKVERLAFVGELRRRGADVETAPSLGEFDLDDFDGDVERLFDLAEGPSIDPNRRREGIVMKSLTGDFAFKVISNKQLLKADRKKARKDDALEVATRALLSVDMEPGGP